MFNDRRAALIKVIGLNAYLFCVGAMAAPTNSLTIYNDQTTSCAAIAIYKQGSTTTLMAGGYRSAPAGQSNSFSPSDLQTIQKQAGTSSFTIQVLQKNGDCPTNIMSYKDADQAAQFDMNFSTNSMAINTNTFCLTGNCDKIGIPAGGGGNASVHVHD